MAGLSHIGRGVIKNILIQNAVLLSLDQPMLWVNGQSGYSLERLVVVSQPRHVDVEEMMRSTWGGEGPKEGRKEDGRWQMEAGRRKTEKSQMGGESGGRDDEKAEVDGQFIDKGSSPS